MKTAAFSAAELCFEAGYPGPRICRTFTRKGAAVSSQGLPGIAGPLGGCPKAGRAAGSFARRSAKADRVTRTSSRRSAKADNDGRLCPGGAFSAARPAGTARFLITRGKASFYETAAFGRRKVFFCSPFCGLLFCPTRAKLALPAGEKPAARNPGRPAAARPTTATGSRFLRRQRERPPRRPRPSPPAREGSLGAPQRPNLSARRRAESPKGKGKEEPRMKRAPPL